MSLRFLSWAPAREAIYPAASAQKHIYVSSVQNDIYTPVPCVMLRIDSLLCTMCSTVQLVPIRLWRTGHGRVVKTLDMTVGVGRCFWDYKVLVRSWASTREAIRSKLEFFLLLVHGDILSCFLHTIWNICVRVCGLPLSTYKPRSNLI